MPDGSGAVLPIRAIASMTGVNPITLRTWERRYALIEPHRTPSGHRLYTQAQVEEVRRVLSLLDRGVPLSRIRDVLAAERTATGRTQNRWQQYLGHMLEAVARFDEEEVDRIYDEALSLYSVSAVTRRLILPLLERLGERWQAIDGAIAEEHFFATYLRNKLGARLQHRVRYAGGPCLLAACVPGEHHEIGLFLFGIEAHEAGFRTVLLGANTPLKEIAVAHRRSACDGIVLSASIDLPAEFFARDLTELIQETTVPVFIGGTAPGRHAARISAAGAIPLGRDIQDGIRVLKHHLADKEQSR